MYMYMYMHMYMFFMRHATLMKGSRSTMLPQSSTRLDVNSRLGSESCTPDLQTVRRLPKGLYKGDIIQKRRTITNRAIPRTAYLHTKSLNKTIQGFIKSAMLNLRTRRVQAKAQLYKKGHQTIPWSPYSDQRCRSARPPRWKISTLATHSSNAEGSCNRGKTPPYKMGPDKAGRMSMDENNKSVKQSTPVSQIAQN